MDIRDFIVKWKPVELKERSASQEHFLDLCRVVCHKTPAEADPDGSCFTFEKGAAKHGGGDGWADVWKKGFFGWEYKGKHKDLDAAYDQLLKYREALENPPLLVVCDMDRIIVHTNFTSTATTIHELPLATLSEPRNIEILKSIFHAPEKLKPGATSTAITAEAAERLGEIAQSIRDRGVDARAAAHFLDRVVFCLFAEDVGLLPEMVFTRIVEKSDGNPGRFGKLVGQLFNAMSTGGDFGLDTIRHFNGNLFDNEPVIDLTSNEMQSIQAAAQLDWTAVDPSIFGTLFERGMDPKKRSQLGAHYTSREDIETLVDPVVMQPLRREWEELRQIVENLLTTGKKHPDKSSPQKKPSAATLRKARGQADFILHQFLTRLHGVKVLDPACGSGNFLYVTLQKLKDLEKEVIVYSMDSGIGGFLPAVGPWQLYGIETSPYAYDLAQMVIWIGFLQWTRANGFRVAQDPILRPMEKNFRCMDSIMDLSDPDNPAEPEWPKVDFIVGNPPFLGDKRMRSELGAEYCQKLWGLYADRIPASSNLCCYWFEKARSMIEKGRCRHAGLLATTGIRQVGGRRVLERIQESGKLFFAVSDRDWVLDGASTRISMVGFADKHSDMPTILDGREVTQINANLTSGCDLTTASRLPSNAHRCFMGTTKVGPFDIEEHKAIEMLQGVNPHGRPNSDVLRPYRNGSDVVRTSTNRWIIDFGTSTSERDASFYEEPFEFVRSTVKPMRDENSDRWRREHWWLLGRTLSDFRKAVQDHSHYIATPRVAKHRVFVWFDASVLPDSKVIAIAEASEWVFGLLQSRPHTVWTAANCGWHGIGNDITYNPTTCFETFPFPVASDTQMNAIAEAARRLDESRRNWLYPQEWVKAKAVEFPASVGGPWRRHVQAADSRGIGTATFSRMVPKDGACASKLKKRTLTALCNQRPAWLDFAHRELDEAVFAAYDWAPEMKDVAVLEQLLELNRARSTETGATVA
ncbi:MAG: class I SAM-dependent DNA methyltransferase [Planctomycetes bacterium]|nr:class I SAM-dependent DNA methyltransferase [Planctomycetota bacterium]